MESVFQHYKINALVVTERDYKDVLVKRELFDIDFEYANMQIKKDEESFREWLISAINTDVEPVHNEFIRELLQNIHKEEDHVYGEKKIVSALRRENENLRVHNSNLQEHADNLQNAYAEVTNSTIWKATKPIRKILDRVKR